MKDLTQDTKTLQSIAAGLAAALEGGRLGADARDGLELEIKAMQCHGRDLQVRTAEDWRDETAQYIDGQWPPYDAGGRCKPIPASEIVRKVDKKLWRDLLAEAPDRDADREWVKVAWCWWRRAELEVLRGDICDALHKGGYNAARK